MYSIDSGDRSSTSSPSMRDRRPTLSELEALRATLAEGSTAAAARRLGRSQSSISRALASLEDRLGRRLFETAGRGLRPTGDALAIDRELDTVFASLDRLSSRSAVTAGRMLRIAAPPTFAVALVPPIFAAYRRRHGDVRLDLSVVASADVAVAVAAGSADLGLTDTVMLDTETRIEPFHRSEMVAIAPQGHRLSTLDMVTAADLAGLAFVELARGHSMRRRVDALLDGVDREIVAEAATALAAVELVRQGVGVTLLNPFPVLNGRRAEGLILRRFAPSLTYQAVCVLPAGPASPEAMRFVRFLKRRVGAEEPPAS